MAAFIALCAWTILYLIAFQIARVCLKDKGARIMLAIVFWVVLWYGAMRVFVIFMEDIRHANYILFTELLRIVYNSLYWPSILGLVSLAALIFVVLKNKWSRKMINEK